MSHSPPGYMDGVPVKISERFKPPPKIVLPQGVVNRLSQYDVGQVLRESCYGCELEDTVLKRMTEWRAITERERSERSSRLRVQEQTRLRHIEDEQNRKLHQISYPNTDELSSASDDNGDADVPCRRSARPADRATDDDDEEEEEEENDESAPSGSSDERTANAKPFDRRNQFSSILVPTVIREVAPSAAQTQAYSAAPVGANITIPKTAQIGTELNTAPIATFGNNNNNNNNNYNKINYSDFENDTSSPFDNLELRTINDLDILAQVLKLNTNLTSPTVETEHQQTKEVETAEILQQPPQQQQPQRQPQQQLQQQHQQQQPEQQLQQQQQQQQQHLAVHSNDQYTTPFTTNQQYSMPQSGYPLNQYQFTQTSVTVSGANDYHGTSYSNYHQQYAANYAAPYDSTAMATPGYSSATAADNRYGMNAYTSPTPPYHVPVSQSHQPEYRPAAAQSYAYGYHYPCSIVPSTSLTGGSTGNTYATNYGYSTATNTTTTAGTVPYMVPTYHGYQSSSSSSGCTPTNPSVYSTNVTDVNDGEASGAVGLRSKSRSVPDILRQLNEELQDSATRRTRNNSQTISDGRSATTGSENSVSGEKRIDYTQYNQLSHAEQNLVKRISSMGFPLERVVWVLQRIGNDDKKVIEHLIPLSELLDVGFEEQKISDALLKFDNNKHKALDYLIS